MKYIMKHAKSIFYTIVILFLCIVDQRRGSAPGQVQFIFVNLAGAAVCLLMFSAYKLNDFVNLPYGLWTIVYGIGALVVTYFRGELILYQGQWYTALLNIWLLGLLLIKMIIRVVVEKWRPKFSIKALAFFMGFMLLACLSKNDSLWTWWYLVLFSLLYLTEFSDEDKRRLLHAIPNGIIISFLIIQGLAFVFRPYDVMRYSGLYANANINALFYSLVYCSFLGKYCVYVGQDDKIKHCKLIRILLLLFCGAMWTFVCFTMCRTAMLSMLFVTTCAGIYCLCKVRKNIVKNAIGMILSLVIAIVICAPITYCAVRYLPPVFHHPIWFGGEYNPDRVHSWDPVDSPKYISWEQILEGVLGRWKEVDVSDLIVKDENNQAVYIASIDSDIFVSRLVQNQMLLLDINTSSSVNIRMDIFSYYLERLNMYGHLNAESGFLITENIWIPHAHNLFLQMAFWFGIPVAIFFSIWLGYNILTAAKKAFGINRDARMAIILLFYINIVVFGMLEVVWVTGQLSFTLLFLLPLFLFEGKRISIVEK